MPCDGWFVSALKMRFSTNEVIKVAHYCCTQLALSALCLQKACSHVVVGDSQPESAGCCSWLPEQGSVLRSNGAS